MPINPKIEPCYVEPLHDWPTPVADFFIGRRSPSSGPELHSPSEGNTFQCDTRNLIVRAFWHKGKP